jgi:hypothetical protein
MFEPVPLELRDPVVSRSRLRSRRISRPIGPELLQVYEKNVLRWSLQDASMPAPRHGPCGSFPAGAPAHLARAL